MLYDWQVEEFLILVIMLRLAMPPLLHLANIKTRTKAKKIPLFQVPQFVLFTTVNQNQKLESLLPLLIKNPPSYHITQQIHSHMIVNGLLNHSMLLLNTLLRCYSFSDFACKAFLLYKQFQQVCSQSPSFPRPSFDSFTYTFLLNASAGLCHPVMGTQLHCLTEKLGFQCHVYVQTALVNMYVSCGVLREAMQVFDEMPLRNSVTWNIMITGFTKWGELETARSLFDKMPDRTVVSWTGIIDGYTRMNRHGEAVALFREMVASDIKPTEITMLAIFPSVRSDLKICQSIHGYIEKSGFDGCDIRVSNSLIDTYAKCGCIMSASRFFEEINDERKNLVSWTSIISGFAMHGMGKEAVESFERMEKTGLKPNRVALLSLLNACSHAGLVELGLNLFNKLVDEYQVSPDIKHYGCLIDMLGRAGRLEEAEKMALEIPNEIVNDVIWRTLLSACSFHGAIEMGERATRKIMEIEKGHGVDYVLMSNIFASAGRFDDVEKLRRLLDERNVLKLPGKSLL